MADPKKVRADANALAVELLARLATDEIQELEVKRGALRVRVSKAAVAPLTEPARSAAPAAAAPAAPAAASEAATRPAVKTINAPLTGIFYRSPSPQAPPFIQVGSQVTEGEVIGLIEAMKLFNEIRATASGRVQRMFIENGQLVRAKQPIVELD